MPTLAEAVKAAKLAETGARLVVDMQAGLVDAATAALAAATAALDAASVADPPVEATIRAAKLAQQDKQAVLNTLQPILAGAQTHWEETRTALAAAEAALLAGG